MRNLVDPAGAQQVILRELGSSYMRNGRISLVSVSFVNLGKMHKCKHYGDKDASYDEYNLHGKPVKRY